MKPIQAIRASLHWKQIKRSLLVALIVGTILNLINQADAVVGKEEPVIWRILLTYCVPFFVATYGAYSAFRASVDEI